MPEKMIPVLSRAEIAKKVKTLAQRISEDYAGKELIVIGVLKGGFIFLADLIRELTIPPGKLWFQHNILWDHPDHKRN